MNNKKVLPSKAPEKKINLSFFKKSVFFLFCFLLPTQLGNHFFLDFSYLSGVRVDYLAPTLYLTDILAVILIFLHLKTQLKFFKQRVFIILGILLIINGFYSLSGELFIYKFIKYIEVFSIFIIFKIHYREYKKYIFAGFIFSVFFQFPLVIAQFIFKHSLQGFWYLFGERYFTLSTPNIAKASLQGVELLRPYGTFSHPNSMAGFFLLVYLFFLVQKEGLRPVLRHLMLGLCTVMVLFSFSKNAVLIYLFLNTLFLFMQKYQCRLCQAARTFFPIGLALVFLTAQTDIQSFDKRFQLFFQSFEIIKTHLFFGVGLGNYLVAQNNFPITYPYFFLQPVHNIFLLFIAEAGVLLSVIVLVYFVRWIKHNLHHIGLIFILSAITLTGLNDHYWLTLQQNMLLAGVLLGIMVYSKNEQTSRNR